MKKILTLLAGIVFLITILVADGCNNSKKENGSTPVGKAPAAVKPDTTTVSIYLKEYEIHGIMHLEMSDSKKPECPVIDNLETMVFPGDTVIFMKASGSKVKEVISVSLVEQTFIASNEDVKVDSGLYVLIIDPTAPMDTIIKYDIEFAIDKDTTYIIDPYLKIPPKH